MSVTREKLFEKRTHRFFRIPQEPTSDADLGREFDAALTRFPVIYKDEQWAKPGTKPDWIALRYAIRMVEERNPNLVEPTMFLGAWEIEREAVSMVGELLSHPCFLDEAYDAQKNPLFGWFTDAGTASLLQACWSLRNNYFQKLEQKKNPSFDIKTSRGILREQGVLGLLKSGLLDLDKPPVILAPVDAHFAVDKSIDLLGLGSTSIVRYGLDENYETDYEALKTLVLELKNNGQDIMFVLATVGAVDTGRVENVAKLSETLREAGVQVPIIVDAAQQFMMTSLLSEKYPAWDFRVEDVAAIVVDPHKTDATPYPGSVILYKDKSLALATQNSCGYLHTDDGLDYDMKATWKLMPQLATSRSPIGAIATWAHLARHGKDKLRKRYEKLYSISEKLAAYIKQSEYYTLIGSQQTGIVTFHVKDFDDKKARALYSRFEQSERRPRFYLSYADGARLRTFDEYKDYSTKKLDCPGEKVEGYGGLYIQVMHHATFDLAEQLIERLETYGKDL